MSIIHDVRKTNQTTFYAAVGVLDLAVEEVRDAQDRAAKARKDIEAELTKARAEFKPADMPARVAALPGKTVDAVMTLAGQAGDTYEELAARGEKLIERIRNQQATKELVATAENTVAIGKGAVTTARNAVNEVEKTTKATLTTGRKEAARAAHVIVESVEDEAKLVGDEIEKSVKRTRTAARRANTTAKKGAQRTTSRTKAAATSARKTAKAAPKAAEKAAEKVGA